MTRFSGLLEWRGSFRHRLVACVAVGLTCQAALAPVAAAAMVSLPGAGRAAAPPPAGAVPAAKSVAEPEGSAPELWAPRAATIVDADAPRGAEALFDGDATTGFTSEAGKSGTVRLELGAAREVVGLGVHGSGTAKIAIYAEDGAGARKLIGTGRDAAMKLESYHWTQLAATSAAKTTALVVQWTASPTAPVTITELALWVSGRSRQALSEAAVADRLVTELPENAEVPPEIQLAGRTAHV